MKTITLKTTILAFAAALLASHVTPLTAKTVIGYDADSKTPAPAPWGEGWIRSASGIGSSTNAGNEMGLNYWRSVSDSSSRVEYQSGALDSSTLDDMETLGWTATAVLRVEEATSGISANYIAVWDRTHRWAVDFKQNAGFEGARYWDKYGSQPIIENFDTKSKYFTFQMYYDPSLDSVLFYLDGSFIYSIARSDTLAQGLEQMRWGQGSTDAAADANWNQCRLEIGNTVIPEQR